MTVKELRAALKNFEDDLEVHVAYPSGDYWRTTVTTSPEEADYGYVYHSSYHNRDQVEEEEPEEDGPARKNRRQVLLLQ
jgi:hypothetical protein